MNRFNAGHTPSMIECLRACYSYFHEATLPFPPNKGPNNTVWDSRTPPPFTITTIRSRFVNPTDAMIVAEHPNMIATATDRQRRLQDIEDLGTRFPPVGFLPSEGDFTLQADKDLAHNARVAIQHILNMQFPALGNTTYGNHLTVMMRYYGCCYDAVLSETLIGNNHFEGASTADSRLMNDKNLLLATLLLASLFGWNNTGRAPGGRVTLRNICTQYANFADIPHAVTPVNRSDIHRSIAYYCFVLPATNYFIRRWNPDNHLDADRILGGRDIRHQWQEIRKRVLRYGYYDRTKLNELQGRTDIPTRDEVHKLQTMYGVERQVGRVLALVVPQLDLNAQQKQASGMTITRFTLEQDDINSFKDNLDNVAIYQGDDNNMARPNKRARRR